MGGGILDAIWILVLGVLAVPNLIIAKRPDAKQILDKLTPFQGWIGLVSFGWGVFRLIQMLGIMGMLFKLPLLAIVLLLYLFCMIVLGLLLGVGTMKMFIKNPQAVAKLDQTIAKLSPKQGIFGILALIDAVGMFLLVLAPGIFVHM